MLNVLRQNSRSPIISIFFGLLIVAFVVNLAPGKGCLFGNKTPANPTENNREYAVRVGDVEITQLELLKEYGRLQDQQEQYLAGLKSKIGGNDEKLSELLKGLIKSEGELKRMALDKLIPSAAQANEAKRLGFLASNKEAFQLLFPQNEEIDARRFKAYLAGLKITEKDFLEIGKNQVLARKALQLFESTISVSEAEAKQFFEIENRQVQLQYVRFSHAAFEKNLLPTDEELTQFAKAHEEELKKEYEAKKAINYQKQDPQIHLYRVLLSVKKEAKSEEIEAVKKRAEDILARLQNKERFAVVAKEVSEDENSKSRGGNWGFKKKGNPGFTKEQEAKIFAAKEGDLIGPEKTDQGFEIWKVAELRQGDVAFEKAQLELAENLYYQQKPKELVKQAADEVMTKLKAGSSLVSLFPVAKAEASEEKKDADKKDSKDDKSVAQKVEDPKTPKLEESPFVSEKIGVTQGVMDSKELGKEAFSHKAGDLLGSFNIHDDYIVAVLKERKEPDPKEFVKNKETITKALKKEKTDYLANEWYKRLCQDMKATGQIKINPDVIPSLQYTLSSRDNMRGMSPARPPQPGNNLAASPAPPYEPCTFTEHELF